MKNEIEPTKQPLPVAPVSGSAEPLIKRYSQLIIFYPILFLGMAMSMTFSIFEHNFHSAIGWFSAGCMAFANYHNLKMIIRMIKRRDRWIKKRDRELKKIWQKKGRSLKRPDFPAGR